MATPCARAAAGGPGRRPLALAPPRSVLCRSPEHYCLHPSQALDTKPCFQPPLGNPQALCTAHQTIAAARARRKRALGRAAAAGRSRPPAPNWITNLCKRTAWHSKPHHPPQLGPARRRAGARRGRAPQNAAPHCAAAAGRHQTTHGTRAGTRAAARRPAPPSAPRRTLRFRPPLRRVPGGAGRPRGAGNTRRPAPLTGPPFCSCPRYASPLAPIPQFSQLRAAPPAAAAGSFPFGPGLAHSATDTGAPAAAPRQPRRRLRSPCSYSRARRGASRLAQAPLPLTARLIRSPLL